MRNDNDNQNAGRLTALADAATKAATDASNEANGTESPAAHLLAAQAHDRVYRAHQAAYDANKNGSIGGAEADVADRHQLQVYEEKQLADHHRNMANQFAGADTLAQKAKHAGWWDILCNCHPSERTHKDAIAAHREAAEAAQSAGNTALEARHCAKAEHHRQNAAVCYSKEMNASGGLGYGDPCEWRTLWLLEHGGTATLQA